MQIEELLKDDVTLLDFLRAHFLAVVVDHVFLAKEQIGLTDKEVAQHLSLPQEIVEYLSEDIEGRMTLGTYFRFVVAHGFIPQFTLIPLEEARKKAIEQLKGCIEPNASSVQE